MLVEGNSNEGTGSSFELKTNRIENCWRNYCAELSIGFFLLLLAYIFHLWWAVFDLNSPALYPNFLVISATCLLSAYFSVSHLGIYIYCYFYLKNTVPRWTSNLRHFLSVDLRVMQRQNMAVCNLMKKQKVMKKKTIINTYFDVNNQ